MLYIDTFNYIQMPSLRLKLPGRRTHDTACSRSISEKKVEEGMFPNDLILHKFYTITELPQASVLLI